MDDYCFAHMTRWINAHYSCPAERIETAEMLLDFLQEYPELLEGHTWTEIRDMAEYWKDIPGRRYGTWRRRSENTCK